MSDTADDLLNELSHLDEATDEMEQQVTSATTKKKTLNKNSEKAASLDAVTVALEAAKTSQMAAEQSQHAAEKAISLTHEQKAQIVELSDANIAWRQSLRSAARDIKSARNAVSIMMTVSITVSVASVGALGWLLFSLNNQYEQLKGDVLDIITTENTLFTKNLTLKVDQLSSLIEALASDIQKLIHQSANLSSASSSAIMQPEMTPKDQPIINLETESEPDTEAEVKTEDPAVLIESQPETTETNIEKTVQTAVDHTEQLAHIEALIQQVIAEQQKLQANALSKIAQLETLTHQGKQPTTSVNAKPAQLNSMQIKQLKSIVASANDQQKLLKEIIATLKSQPTSNTPAKMEIPDLWPQQQDAFKKLSDQIYAMQQKQDVLVTKIETLEALNKEVLSEPKPYSYRSPALPIKTLEATP